MNGSLVNGHDVKISGTDIAGRPVYTVKSLEGKFKFPKGVDKASSETLYLRMTLNSTAANIGSFNDYWMSEPSTYQEYTDLGILRANKLVQVQVNCTVSDRASDPLSVEVQNGNRDSIALAIRLRIIPSTGANDLPTSQSSILRCCPTI